MPDIEHISINGTTYDIPTGGAGAVSSVNGQTGNVVLDADDVGALPDSTSIPSKTSDLQNDSGFITGYTETDPTVPSWAKQSSKPTYTAQEVGALPSSTSIPSKTSDLQNDSGFITGYTETDPTVPSWAKASSKPSYTASEVGALPDSTVIPQGTVTSVRVQATSPVASSTSTAQSTSLNTTISLANAYGDTKNPYGSKTANYVLASPNGSNGNPSFRALVKADLPTLSASDVSAMPSNATFSFTGSSGSVSVSGTPSGSVSAPTISVSSAGATSNAMTGLATAEPDDTAPSNPITYYDYDSTTSTLRLYQIGYNTSSFRTGDASYTASTPTFTGSSTTSTGTFTPSGSVTKD